MLSSFTSLISGGMRAYKVQNYSREKRVGVTAKSLKDLMNKGRQKLQIAEDEEITVVIEDDGTVVDSESFFKNLPSQTVFIFLLPGETWKGVGDLIYNALNKLHTSARRAEVADQIRQLLKKEGDPEKILQLSQYLDMLEVNVEAEDRKDDRKWFDGLNEKYRTKREVMRESVQRRMRSYYFTAKEQIQKETDARVQGLLLELLEDLNSSLRSKDFNSCYFDRREAVAKRRLCDKKGWFRCQGPFDRSGCDKKHIINPYASRGHRLLFGLWNLDHVIEKSRDIIPTLIKAARSKREGAQLNADKVYQLLFTIRNLRLVHIGCHKKAARTKTCRVEDFLIR